MHHQKCTGKKTEMPSSKIEKVKKEKSKSSKAITAKSSSKKKKEKAPPPAKRKEKAPPPSKTIVKSVEKKKKKKKKKPVEEEEVSSDEEVEEEEEEEEEEEVVSSDDDEEEEVEEAMEEEGGDEGDEEYGVEGVDWVWHYEETEEARAKRLQKLRLNARRVAKQKGYRKCAKKAGLLSGSARSFDGDAMQAAFSPADVARMAKWSPSAADVGMEYGHFTSVLEMRDASLPSGALSVLHAHVEKFGRSLVKTLVERNFDYGGPATITAANVRAVLRPLSALMDSEFITPLGLVRVAQVTEKPEKQKDGSIVMKPILPTPEADQDEIAEERKLYKTQHLKALKNANQAVEERKNKKKQKKQKDGGEASATAVV